MAQDQPLQPLVAVERPVRRCRLAHAIGVENEEVALAEPDLDLLDELGETDRRSQAESWMSVQAPGWA